MELIPRAFRPPRQSFFLFGPRGTGKSLWARAAYPEALWIDLLDPATFRPLAARPERLREMVWGGHRKRVVIDEVQKAPELLGVVHALIEERRGLQFVLTGSSARKLRRAGTDLLAGRAVVRGLHAFMAAELGSRFRLAAAVKDGLLPLVVAARDPGQTLQAYHGLYLKEEVQAEGLVRNVGSFARFLEAMSFSHGSVLNLSNVSRECEVERKTAEGYVEILEDLLLGVRVPAFARRAGRATATHPKFYFFDAGVYRSLRPEGPLDEVGMLEGPALEGLVIQHLRAWIDYRARKNRLYFWRTRSGAEVDAVVYGQDGLWAVEVKNSRRVRPEDLRGLRAFREDFPKARTLLLYRGDTRLLIDRIACIPCEEFLRGLTPSRGTLWSGRDSVP